MLPIRTVCALTGVNPITLRAWERRYGLIRPQRAPKGQRLYSEDDVERIRRVLALTREGVAISQVQEALDAQATPIERTRPGPWPAYQKRLMAAVAAFDEAGLESVYAEALALHPVDMVDRLLLLPVLRELGTRWNNVVGGVAEEHFFSAYVRNKLGARFHHRRALDNGPKIVAACAPGEHHEIGLLLFALASHDAGFRVVLLGANVPFADAAAAARRAQCDAVVLSNAIGRSAPEFYEELAAMVKSLQRPVFVGGEGALARKRELCATGALPLEVGFESAVRRIGAEIDLRKARR